MQRGKDTEKEGNVKNSSKEIEEMRWREGREYEDPGSRMLPR